MPRPDGITDVTQILSQIESGDPAAEQLLPLVYDELRKLAAAKLAQEKPGQTLQATALVHEAYLRLVDGETGSALEQPRAFLRGRGRGDAADPGRKSPAESGARSTAGVESGWTSRLACGDRAATDEDLLAWTRHWRLAAEDQMRPNSSSFAYFAGLTIEQARTLVGIIAENRRPTLDLRSSWLHQESGVALNRCAILSWPDSVAWLAA